MKVSVIGLGYVGSVAAAGFAAAGHEVLGIDVDEAKVDSFRTGKIPFHEPGLSELFRSAVDDGRLRILQADEVSESLGEVIVIAVGTPQHKNGGASLDYVRSAISWVCQKQPEGGTIVMKSTVPPGTGTRLVDTILRGTHFDYISNPEFLREGQAVSDWFNPDRIVIGASDTDAVAVVENLYAGLEAPRVVTDIASAEMIKYSANAFLATKISFINEIAMLSDKVGANIDNVASGIALDPRIGSSFLRAGVGYGGSCFPKDTEALDDLALSNGYTFELLRSVIRVNNRQRLLPAYVLRETFGSLRKVKVGVLGLAFKPNTDDIRESPAMELIRVLLEEGAEVTAYDPIAMDNGRAELGDSINFATDIQSCAEDAQALVLVTEWPQIVGADWESVVQVMKAPSILFDGRNALDANQMSRLGFDYVGVGRKSSVDKPVFGGAKSNSYSTGAR